MSDSDPTLLGRFHAGRSEEAFRELIERHAGLVYSVALRFPGLEPVDAEEVAQEVFLLVAGKASELRSHPSLVAWLFKTTRHLAARYRRSEVRRLIRQRKACEMFPMETSESALVDWAALRPVVDEAVGELERADQLAVLWRYYERLDYVRIGHRLGVSEEAARKRVGRSLHALRSVLSKRGMISSVAAMDLAMGAHAVVPVPGALTRRIASAALAATASGPALALLQMGSLRRLSVLAGGRLRFVAVAVVSVAVLLQGLAWLRDAGRDRDPQQAAHRSQPPGIGTNGVHRLFSAVGDRLGQESDDLEDARRRLREVLGRGDVPYRIGKAIELFGDRTTEAFPILLEALKEKSPGLPAAAATGMRHVLGRLSGSGRESERMALMNQIRPILGAALVDPRTPAPLQTRALEILCLERSESIGPEDLESLAWLERVLHESPVRQIDLRLEIVDRLLSPAVQRPGTDQLIVGLRPLLDSPDPADRILAAFALAGGGGSMPSAVVDVLIEAVREPSRYRSRGIATLEALGPLAAKSVPVLLGIAGVGTSPDGLAAREALCRIDPEQGQLHPELREAVLRKAVRRGLVGLGDLDQAVRDWLLDFRTRGTSESLAAEVARSLVAAEMGGNLIQSTDWQTRLVEALHRVLVRGEEAEAEWLRGVANQLSLHTAFVDDESRVAGWNLDSIGLTLSARALLRVLPPADRVELEELIRQYESKAEQARLNGDYTALQSLQPLVRLMDGLATANPAYCAAFRRELSAQYPGLPELLGVRGREETSNAGR